MQDQASDFLTQRKPRRGCRITPIFGPGFISRVSQAVLALKLLCDECSVLQLMVRRVVATLACVVLIAFARPMLTQSPSQRSVGPTHPTQVPLQQTPNSAGGVSIQQQTSDPGGNSVLSTSTRTDVQPPYSGSVPGGPRLPDVLQLTLADALARGLRANLAALTEDAMVQQARSQRLSARSELLPTLNSAISEELERVNLRTTGVESPSSRRPLHSISTTSEQRGWSSLWLTWCAWRTCTAQPNPCMPR